MVLRSWTITRASIWRAMPPRARMRLALARDLKQGAAMPGWDWGGWFVRIVDEDGRKIDEIPIADA
jgi:hypothetical protein